MPIPECWKLCGWTPARPRDVYNNIRKNTAARTGPAYRIETERLVIRCWHPTDAPLLKEAIDCSLDHLRPWLPWAHDEPQELDRKVEHLRRVRADFDSGKDFVYGILSNDEKRVLGGTGLHRKLGFIREENIRTPQGEKMIWSMHIHQYGNSLCASANIRAFDVAGRQFALAPKP